MRLGLKLLVPQLLLLAMLLIASALLFFDLARQQQSLRSTRQQFQAAALFAERIDKLNENIAIDVLSYVVDRKTRRLNSIVEADSQASNQITSHAPSVTDARERALLEAVTDSRRQTASSRSEFLQAVAAGNAEAVQAGFERWRIHRSLLDANLSDLAVFTVNRFTDSTEAIERERLGVIVNSLYGLAFAIAVTIAAFYYVRREMVMPLVSLAQGIEQFGHGNLDSRIDRRTSDRSDEIGVVGKAFNRMASQLEALNRELERRVRERTAQLEASNKELEAFAYSVSHDLRAPLRAIDGFSHAVMDDYADKLGDDGRDSLQRVRNASGRMAQLIDDMLRLSRVTRSDMNLEQVDLSALAESEAAELRKSDPARKVAFDISPGISARGDPRLLSIVLENLLGNAWKFTGKREASHIELCAQDNDGEVTYFVRDDGAGFDMQYVGNLFNPFQRLHPLTEFPGTGIGLATVKRIVARHGGRVWAEGAVDKGATFYFTLPKA